jgi:replicative DNA helicase
MDEYERLAISYPLWDTWQDHAAAAMFCERMKPEMFARPEYRTCAEILLQMLPDHPDMSIATLQLAYKHRTGQDIAYAMFTHDLDASQGQYACYAVATMWQRRELAIVATTAAQSASNEALDVYDVIALTAKRIGEIEQAGTFGQTDIVPVVDRVTEAVDAWVEGRVDQYTRSGFTVLDREIGGLPLSEVVVLAAMTGAGKTAIMCNMALGRAKHNLPTLVFSAEMTSDSMVERLAAIQARQNLTALRFRKNVSPSDYDAYRAALREVRAMPIRIDDRSSPTLAQIESRILAQNPRPQVVFVDYLEKVDAGFEKSEELRVSRVAQGLKTIAKRTGVCILVLSQYAREKDSHKGVPRDTWLRYSGKIEQEAAMIFHWWWPGYYVQNKGLEPGEVYGYDPAEPERGKLMLTKNRYGRSHQHDMMFKTEIMKFYEYERDAPATGYTPYPAPASIPPSFDPFTDDIMEI